MAHLSNSCPARWSCAYIKLDNKREKVEDVVNIGDEIMVKVIEIDNKGRINLSEKTALAEQEK